MFYPSGNSMLLTRGGLWPAGRLFVTLLLKPFRSRPEFVARILRGQDRLYCSDGKFFGALKAMKSTESAESFFERHVAPEHGGMGLSLGEKWVARTFDPLYHRQIPLSICPSVVGHFQFSQLFEACSA